MFSVISRLIGFLYKIFLSRVISTESLGLYSIVLSIYMVFITLVSSGMPIAISKLTASNKVNKNYISTHSLVYGALKIEIIFSLILVFLIVLCKGLLVPILGNESSYFLLLSLTPAIISAGIYSPFRGYLWGEEHYLKVSLVEFFEQIIKIIVLFVLIKLSFNLENLLPLGIAISISAILSTVIGIIYYFTSGGKLSKKEIKYKPIIDSALPLTTTRFCGSLMQPIISVLLPLRLVSFGFSKSQALSALGVAMGMTFPILTIPSTLIGSLSMALIPEIASLIKQNNIKALQRQINSSILFTMCCSFLCFIFILPLAHPICDLLFENYDAGTYLIYASWIIIPTGLSAITTSILNSLGHEKFTFKYFVYSAILSILIIVFIPKYVGVHSLFISTGLGMSLIYFLNIKKINKTLNIRQASLKYLLSLALISAPCLLLSKWLYNIFELMYGTIFGLIASASITIVCFVLLLLVFNLLDINIIIKNIKSSNKPIIQKEKHKKVKVTK